MGPLHGLRVIELAGLGPAPFCGMLLADMGAELLRVERLSAADVAPAEPIFSAELLGRGRHTLALDLKQPADVALLLRLVEGADALIEGFRPGVMERLGLGPETCLARNPHLVYGRMTGYGQHGPLAQAAGHDLNYIALSGALHAIGAPEAPSIPLNLLGDFGGGGMLLAFGLLCALLEAQRTGRGQVVDAAMTDGAALLMTMIYGLRGMGDWRDERGANVVDGGAPFYTTYACADGKWLAVAALEPQFYARLLERAGVAGLSPADQWERASWPAQRAVLAAHFRARTRDAWCELLAGADCCVSPVLGLDEAPDHPHNQARASFAESSGAPVPAPAPRLSRTPPTLAPPATPATGALLAAWGLDAAEIAAVLAKSSLPPG